MTQMNLSIKTEKTHIHGEEICGCQGGKGVQGGIK